MDLLSILLIAVSVSLDCFAVALGGSVSMPGVTRRQVLRVALSFGLFQAGMLAVGWLAGRTLVDIIEGAAPWVAFALLSLVGARMLWESSHSEDGRRTDITKGLALLAVSVATSIDSLAVGLGLGFLESRLLIAAAAIGSVAFLFTAAGFYLGNRIGGLLGRWAEVLGGMVLIGLGLRILLTHIL